jgi:hypothetical protein
VSAAVNESDHRVIIRADLDVLPIEPLSYPLKSSLNRAIVIHPHDYQGDEKDHANNHHNGKWHEILIREE